MSCRVSIRLVTLTVLLTIASAVPAQPIPWGNLNGNPQHTGAAPVPSRVLDGIRWQMPVDLNPQYSGSSLLIHYGSPLMTNANTVVVPVKTGATDGFRVEGRAGANGSLLWTQNTDYLLPTPHGWTPSYGPTIAPGGTLYFPGVGGTVYSRSNLDAAGSVTPTQRAFYGIGNYQGNPTAYQQNVFINTPITSDAAGNVYFGYQVMNSAAVGGLQSGLARIDAAGNGTFVPAASLAPTGDTSIRKLPNASAPAISPDGSKVYFAITSSTGTGSGNGYLVALNTANMSLAGRVDLVDPRSGGNRARISESGSASPTVGPDGTVFFGVLENPFTSARGWMMQYNATLNQSGTPAAFGWDSTPSIVPRSMVPSYQGTSQYLLFTKYNNYAGAGGDGVNKIAVLDPNDTQVDPRTGATVMKEILTVAGLTPDPDFIQTHPNAVREWCINSAAVDAFTNSILVNSEDGKAYRWDLTTNLLTQPVVLTPGLGEAYTPTVVGPDGTVYAINNATLFALGLVPVPEPSALVLAGVAVAGIAIRRRRP